jgi:hypothetical protein
LVAIVAAQNVRPEIRIVTASFCANHPERPGRAVCMKCRKTVCLECATQWDGINYCVDCLKKVREAAKEKSSLFAWAVMLLAIAGLYFAASFIMVWASAIMVKMLA